MRGGRELKWLVALLTLLIFVSPVRGEISLEGDLRISWNITGTLEFLSSKDYNGDGLPDIGVSDSDSVSLISGKTGNIIWETYIGYSDYIGFYSIGDVDGDDIDDLFVYSSEYSDTLLGWVDNYTLLSGGSGEKLWEKGPFIDWSAYAIGVNDVSGDGKNDLLLIFYSTGDYVRYYNLSMVEGISGVEVWNRSYYIEGGYVDPKPAGDLDKDGREDLLVVVHNFTDKVELINGSNGSLLWDKEAYDGMPGGDLDGDGYVDVVISLVPLKETAVFRGYDGKELWRTSGWAYRIEDLNGDGVNEIYVSDGYSLKKLDNNGNVLWSVSTGDRKWVGIGGCFKDVNGDGIGEVVITTYEEGWPMAPSTNSTVLCIDGSSGSVLWNKSWDNLSEGRVIAECVGDLDGDAKRDLSIWVEWQIYNETTGWHDYYINITALQGVSGKIFWVIEDYLEFIGDFNGDGKGDVVYINGSSYAELFSGDNMSDTIGRVGSSTSLWSGWYEEEEGIDYTGDNLSDVVLSDGVAIYMISAPGIKNRDTGEIFVSIQEAIDDPDTLEGHTIFVGPGTYVENVVMDKSINLVGLDAFIKASNPFGGIFFVNASNVNLTGFTISGAQGDAMHCNYIDLSGCAAGVWVNNSNVNIYGNIFEDNLFGVFECNKCGNFSNTNVSYNTFRNNSYGVLIASENSSVKSNVFEDNPVVGVLLWYSNGSIVENNSISNTTIFDGIAVFYSKNNTLRRNTIRGCAEGIWVNSSTHISIADNILIENNNHGIVLRSSNYSEILNNTAANSKTYHGIALYSGSSFNLVSGNDVYANSDNGILLDENTSYNNVTKNNVYNNSGSGVRLYKAGGGNLIVENTLTNNSFGVSIENSSGNLIYHNNFINNVNQAYDNTGNTWDNGYPSGGNYWSDWTSPDLYFGEDQNISGSDGIVDQPYGLDLYPFTKPNGWLIERGYYSNTTLILNGTKAKVIDKPDLEIEVTANKTNATLTITAMVSSENIFAPDNITAVDRAIKYIQLANSSPLENISNITLRLYYTEEEISGLDEDSLALYYWNGSKWFKCKDYIGRRIDNLSPYIFDAGVDKGQNYVYAVVDHFSVYGIGGETYTPQPTPTAGGGGGGAAPKPKIVLLANSIDLNLSSNFTVFLKGQGVDIIYVNASNFSEYKQERFIVILGGPDAYEGVGEIVREVLNESEQGWLREKGNRRMYVKTNVWRTGQVVMIIAGSDREETQKACEENKGEVKGKIK
jgi:parallel beta-helix repeat protein